MLKIALKSLEKAINFYLRLDTDNLARLGLLDGKIIQLCITDWHIAFYIYPHATGLRLEDVAAENQNPDTVISGTLFGLFKAGLAKGKSTALFENAIEISGNTQVGEKMRHILADMDIDWEEHLSRCIGDIAAHKIAVGIKHTTTFSKKTLFTLKENLKEFLQSESRTVPAEKEVTQFIEDVTQLQHAVDRAEARIDRLQTKKSSNRKASP